MRQDQPTENRTSSEDTELLKKLLILELFKLKVPQNNIARKLKINVATVNALLKGIKKSE